MTLSSNPTFSAALNFLLAHRDDYAAAREGFRWPRPTHFNWALDHFDAIARDNQHPALWLVNAEAEQKLTFAELARRSDQAANFLQAQGFERGDRVLIMLPNHIALWEIMLGCMKLGAVTIPCATLLADDDLADRIERGQVRHIVTMADYAQRFSSYQQIHGRIAVDGQPEGWTSFADSHQASADFTPAGVTAAHDPMLLYFTSGTTSKPKLVVHSHASYPIGHLATLYWLGLQPGDIHYNVSSPGWAKHAWSSFFAPLTVGATVYSYQYERFDAKTVLDEMVRCKVTSVCAPPTVWRMLVQEDLASYPVALRELVGAGEPLNPEIIERVRHAWGLSIRNGYGQTETTAQIGNSPGQPLRSGSMGRPLPGYDIVLLDADDLEAEEGEIALVLDPAPASLTSGYEGDPERTNAALGGRYYRTGDVAIRDAAGYFTYVGRSDDVFKSSGYRISPFELESVLIEHEAVAEAAVIPSPDPVRSCVPKAFVILRHGHTPSPELACAILEFARQQLAPYKRVRRIEFSDLPKTISGKIRRVELRAQEIARAPDCRGELEFWEEDFNHDPA